MRLSMLGILLLLSLPGGILCVYTTYVEEHTVGRLPCKHDVPDDQFYLLRWFKSTRDDKYENKDPALVSWVANAKPHKIGNYDINKDFSLVIYNTSIHDEGLYRCYVTRNIPGESSHHDVKVITYGSVKSAHKLEIECATDHKIPCSHKSARYSGDPILWYKRHSNDSFKSDDQPIASWPDNGIHVLPKYTLTNDSSLEIQNVSLEDEAVYRSISTSPGDTRPTASETNVTVYVLPRKKPSIQHFFQAGVSFISCSVDYVYPRRFPEINFLSSLETDDIKNEDGTYNTSISGNVVHHGRNVTMITVECTFPHFNYTEKSLLPIPVNISDEEEGLNPIDCSASACGNHITTTTGVVIGTLIMLTVIVVILLAVFLRPRLKRKRQQKNVIKSSPETTPMV